MNWIALASLLVSVIALLVGTLVSLSQGSLNRSIAARNRAEDAAAKAREQSEAQRDATIHKLEAQLADRDRAVHEATTKLVDERLRAMTHELNGHVQPLISVVDELRQRLSGSEDGLGELVERDHKIELAVAAKFDAVKDWIREFAATKEDMRGHEQSMGRKMDLVVETLGALGQKVAVLSDRLERESKRAGGPGGR